MSDNNSEPNRTQTGCLDNYNYEILPEDYSSFDMSFKLIVIGDSGVGKSCLTNNAIKNLFDDAYNATVGFEFFTFNIKLNGKVVKLQIWDTCGQELYRSLITNFYRNSSLAIIVYAINAKDTFDNIEMWLRELRTHSSPDVKVILIGNKADLEAEREVTTQQGKDFSTTNKMNVFMEASAKTGLNAQNVFIKAAQILYEDYNKYQDQNEDTKTDGTVNSEKNKSFQSQKLDKKSVANNEQIEKKKKGCC